MHTITTLKARLTASLAATPGVNEITTFGSFAKGTQDGYSDVDVLVSVSAPFTRMAYVHQPGDILYYRPFSSTRYPCGRYWVKGYSVFNKIDISFHPPAEYASIVPGGCPETFKTPPFVVEWTRAGNDEHVEAPVMVNPYVFTDAEMDISALVYKLSLAVAAYYRGTVCKYGLADMYGQLGDLWRLHKGREWVGGALDVLVDDVMGRVAAAMLAGETGL